MKLIREWSCREENNLNGGVVGYVMQLDCGKHRVSRFIEKTQLTSSVNPNSFMEYQIIRLNIDLANIILPLTRFL